MTMCIILLCLFAILNFVDIIETNYAVKALGVRERNPFMRFIVHRTGLPGMILVKCLVIAYGVFLVAASEWTVWVAVAICGMLIIVCSWNMGIITGLRQKLIV